MENENADRKYWKTTTQTVTLPVTSTLVLGQQFSILNSSTGIVTINSYFTGLNGAAILNFSRVQFLKFQ